MTKSASREPRLSVRTSQRTSRQIHTHPEVVRAMEDLTPRRITISSRMEIRRERSVLALPITEVPQRRSRRQSHVNLQLRMIAPGKNPQSTDVQRPRSRRLGPVNLRPKTIATIKATPTMKSQEQRPNEATKMEHQTKRDSPRRAVTIATTRPRAARAGGNQEAAAVPKKRPRAVEVVRMMESAARKSMVAKQCRISSKK